MALTVAELRTKFTADVSDFERGTQAVERSTRQTASQISAVMRRAGVEGGDQFARGATSGIRGIDSRFAAEGRSAGRAFGAGAGRVAGAEMGTQIRRHIAALGIGTLAIQGFGKTISLAKDFDLTMRQVGVQTGQTGKQVEQLRQQALQMGSDTVFSAKDAGDAMLELAKGGMSAAEIKAGALRAAMLLAAAGQTSMGDAATYTVQGMTTFGLKASQAKQVAVALSGGALASTASVQSLGEALSQVGPGAKTAGLSLQETVAALSAFDNAGIKGSDAGTSLKTFLASLVPTTKQAKESMDAYGLSFVNTDGSMKSLAQVSEQLHDRLGGLSQAQKTAALNMIFGSDAARAASVLMNLGADGVRKYEKATRDQTAAQKLANTGMEGASGAFEQFQGSVETLAIKTGTKLLPALTKGANKAGEFVDQMSSGKGAGGEFADAVGDVADAVGEVAKGAGKVAGAWGKLPDSVQGAILKTAVYGAAVGGVLLTVQKLSRAWGSMRAGASILSGGKLGGGGLTARGAGSVGTMTVRAGVVNVTGGTGVGPAGPASAGRSGPTVTPTPTGPSRPMGPTIGPNMFAAIAMAGLYPDTSTPSHKKLKQSDDVMQSSRLAAGGKLTGAGMEYVKRGGMGLNKPGMGLDPGALKMVKDYQAAVAKLPTDVQTNIAAPGATLSAAEVKALGDLYDLTPDQIQTLMQVTGAQEGTRALDDLLGVTGRIPGQKETNVEVRTRKALGLIGDYLRGLNLTPDEIQTAMTTDTSQGTGKLRAYLRSLGLTPPQVSTVVKALTAGAKGDLASVMQRLGVVDRSSAQPRVTARDQSSNVFSRIRDQLAGLDGRVATTYVRTVRQGAAAGAAAGLAKADGGWIYGPGGPREDRIPAMLSNGEFVVNAAASAKHGRLLEQLNSNRYADGGPVGALRLASGGPATVSNLQAMTGVDFSKLTKAWLDSATALTKAAQDTTTSKLADVQAQKTIADLYAQLKGAKGLDRTSTLLELQKAKEDLGALRAQGAARLLTDTGTSARDKTLDRSGIFGTGALTASQLLRNLQSDAVTNQQFAGIVAQLSKQGLSKELLDQFTKEGASAASLALGKSILSTGNIAQLNAVQSTLGTQATQAGFQAQGQKAPGAAGATVNIEKYYEAGKSTDQIAEELWFKSQVRTG